MSKKNLNYINVFSIFNENNTKKSNKEFKLYVDIHPFDFF